MSVENEVVQLRERVSELERRMDTVFRQLGLEGGTLPGTKAATISPKVRDLIAHYRIIEAMSAFDAETDGAQDLTREVIARVYQEESGQPFDAKRAR
jgi:hypothetical protein